MLLVIGYLVYGRTNSNRRSPNPSQKRKQRDSERAGNGKQQVPRAAERVEGDNMDSLGFGRRN